MLGVIDLFANIARKLSVTWRWFMADTRYIYLHTPEYPGKYSIFKCYPIAY